MTKLVSSCRPQKKRAKTDKAQSANKHAKMDVPPEMLSPIPSFVKSDDEVLSIHEYVPTISISATYALFS